MTNKLCMRCLVSGKVQGVWYRATTKEQAEQLAVTGWAKNLADGSVEVMACGSAQQLQELYEWLQQGPLLAKVEECSREHLSWQEYEGFDIF